MLVQLSITLALTPKFSADFDWRYLYCYSGNVLVGTEYRQFRRTEPLRSSCRRPNIRLLSTVTPLLTIIDSKGVTGGTQGIAVTEGILDAF